MYHTMPKAWHGTPIYANNKFRKEMIDRFDFKFESRYIGLWYKPNNSNKQYSGTLFLEKQNIYIELYFLRNIIKLVLSTCITNKKLHFFYRLYN